MWLFIFILLAGCIAYLFFLRKNHGSNSPEVLSGKDDFAGDSLHSIFLLEDIVDPDVGDQEVTNHGVSKSEQIEKDYFDDEDEFYDDEFFD